jgi:G:T-mismatch repair DNA endonuclease (very short patch repair protein)
MKQSYYKSADSFVRRYCGISPNAAAIDEINTLIKKYTISQISNKQTIIQNFLKCGIANWCDRLISSKSEHIGSLPYFIKLYGDEFGKTIFDVSNINRRNKVRETHFRSVDQLLSQKPIRELSESFSDNIRTNLARLIPLYDKNVLINRKLCMLRTLIENDVSEVPWDILFERSKNLKNDACSLEGLILKYGESVGRKLFSVRGEAVAVTKESYTKNHTEAEWLELCERKKSNLGESGYIEKFGEVEGRRRWNEYLANWNVGIQKRKASGIWKNGLTLEEFQNKWGMEEGYARWRRRIDDRKKTLSLVGYIQKYGKIDGALKWEMYCKSNNKTSYESFINRYGQDEGTRRYIRMAEKILKYQSESVTYSKVSQELFNNIEPHLDNKSEIKYALHGGEQYFFINEEFCQGASVDFKYGNVIIEFYGDYWHGNPRYYSANEIVPVRGGPKLAKDIWEYDTKRIDWLTKKGYIVLIIWEADYASNKDIVTQNCINFILNNYERAQS